MRGPQRFRKRPVEIQAWQITAESADAVAIWCGGSAFYRRNGERTVEIATLEGVLDAVEGDWVIRGIEGEFYPCAPSIFDATYDPI